MKPALQKEETTVTVALPHDLHEQISDKANSLGTDFQTVVATLLRIGLDAQSKREAEISEVVNRIASSTDETTDAAAADRLSDLMFGR